jgi:hypothetical protein
VCRGGRSLRVAASASMDRCHICVRILIVPSGFRNSCAMPAANWPSAESRSLWRNCDSNVRSFSIFSCKASARESIPWSTMLNSSNGCRPVVCCAAADKPPSIEPRRWRTRLTPLRISVVTNTASSAVINAAIPNPILPSRSSRFRPPSIPGRRSMSHAAPVTYL